MRLQRAKGPGVAVASANPAPAATEPPSRTACWVTFVKWAFGTPAIVASGIGIIAGSLWLVGGQGLVTQAEMAMWDALFWIAVIVLLYPLMLVIWVLELRDGLKARAAWERMSPEERAAAAAAAGAAPAKQRRARKGKRS